MASRVCRTLGALAVAGTLVLTGCVADESTDETTQRSITVGQQTTGASSPTGTSQGGPGDHDVGFGLVLTLPEGWELTTSDTDGDDEKFHGFTHVKTGGQVAVVTDDDMDDSPAEECADIQDEMADDLEDNGPVTRTQGVAHSDNAHTCGLNAKDDEGIDVEITIFVAKGARASFMTAAMFPKSPPQGVTQDELDQAVREASTMSSQLLTNID